MGLAVKSWPNLASDLGISLLRGTVTGDAPHQARNWLKAIRHLMQFAITAELCTADPTQGIRIKLPKSDGYYTWTEEDVAAYEAKHAIGSKERLALALDSTRGSDDRTLSSWAAAHPQRLAPCAPIQDRHIARYPGASRIEAEPRSSAACSCRFRRDRFSDRT